MMTLSYWQVTEYLLLHGYSVNNFYVWKSKQKALIG